MEENRITIIKKDFYRKFRHKYWYQEENWTVQEFLENAGTDFGFYVDKAISNRQSDNLFDDVKYDYYIKNESDNRRFKISLIEKEYFEKIKTFIYNWHMQYGERNFKEEFRNNTRLYTEYCEKESENFKIDYDKFLSEIRSQYQLNNA